MRTPRLVQQRRTKVLLHGNLNTTVFVCVIVSTLGAQQNNAWRCIPCTLTTAANATFLNQHLRTIL
jgi:hypothetical protein